MPKLLFQGHGSLRLIADDGMVIYVDPAFGSGYDLPADLILITHDHPDHNKPSRCAKKPNCRIIGRADALIDGKYQSFDTEGIHIEAVPAHNAMHKIDRCVGYLITIDGVKIYISGDTSTTAQMQDFAKLHLDYAILCGDGIFNMGLKESAACAQLINAKHNILIHAGPLYAYSRRRAERWPAPNKLIMAPNDEIWLTMCQG